ncbi:iron-containing alcohol dehydrogenase, partial [Thermaurantiacus sp.]
MDFRFRYGPSVEAGPGVSAQLPAYLPPGPVLFVTDAQILGLGLARPALAALRRAGHDVVIFSEVEADPSEATLLAAVAAGRAGGIASVVGFGGGSPMDVAKLAALLLGSGEPLEGAWG